MSENILRDVGTTIDVRSMSSFQPVLPVYVWSRLTVVATADATQSEALRALFRKSDIST